MIEHELPAGDIEPDGGFVEQQQTGPVQQTASDLDTPPLTTAELAYLVAALWATHLIDEVGEGARVVVLHKGEVLADRAAAQLLGEMRAPSMRAAFETLVQERETV